MFSDFSFQNTEPNLLPPEILDWVLQQPHAVLLETSRPGGDERRSYIFLHPLRVLQCTHLSEVSECLHLLQQYLGQGYYAAGFLSYEAGYAFEKRLTSPAASALPLVRFGIFPAPWVYNHHDDCWEMGEAEIHKLALPAAPQRNAGQFHPTLNLSPSLAAADYHRAIGAIKTHIARGDTYQVNFTFKVKFPFAGAPAALYQQLRARQRVGYGALLRWDEHTALSFSPELFFRVHDRDITLKPMKGTAPRGLTPEEDDRERQSLLHSEKNRAENLMIVDLLRNDVGRIAMTGSVRVMRFFELEKYETVWQATSTITAKLRPQITVLDLMRSLFPCGSVTGAPKIRTMQIIRALEQEPRGVYCGSIGFFAPGLRQAIFNVAIRTVVLDHARGAGEMGVGSGVVWDSDPAAEYRECLLKARFLPVASG